MVYAYDEQVQGAYRHPEGKMTAKEYAIWDDTQTEMQAPAVAIFGNGDRWECPAVTNEEVLATKTKASSDTVVYAESTDGDGNELALREVKRKGVRWLQIWNSTGNKQVAQCTDTSDEAIKLLKDCMARY